MERVSIAKISKPVVKEAFPRKRLFSLLDRMQDLPVTWISSPAGSGKTTLVASYVDAKKIPCLWYQVDQGDSDIATFFYYMGLAGRKAAPRFRKPLPLLTPEYLQGISTFTLRYFENLFSRFKAPFILVLDNYHRVSAGSNFHDVISDGLSAIPPGINVIILSRHDLPPVLTRLHANGLMGTLGWDKLRLTLEESAGIVWMRAKRKLPKGTMRYIHNAADGWAVGLILMLENLLREGAIPEGRDKLTPKEIIDYFGSELFERTDKETQEFLLKTSFLSRISVKMAEKLTGLPNAGSVLSALNRNNNFTVVHYSPEPEYQYHQLFSEFLMARAKETFSNETLSTLLRQAATLLEETGQTETAILLFRDIGEWDAMGQLIMRQAPLMLAQGRYRSLEEWLDSLPKYLVENDPWLLYWKGASRLPFDPSHAQSYFEQAFEGFRTQGNLPGVFLGWSGAVDCILYSLNNFEQLDQWIELFPDLPENPEESLPPEVWIRVVSSMVTALTFHPCPKHSEIEVWLRRGESMVKEPGVSVAKAQVLLQLFYYYSFIGDFEQSSLAIRLFERLVQSKEAPSVVLIMKSMAEGMHYQLMGDHEKCLKAVSNGLRTSEDNGIYFLKFLLIGHAITSCQNAGDLEMAQTMLQKIVSSWDRCSLHEKSFYHFCQARQFLLRSDLGGATVQAELALKTTKDSMNYRGLCLCYLLTSQIMHKIGEVREAWTHLYEAFRIGEDLRSKRFEYSGLMIEAHFHFEQGDEASGLASLRKALFLGKERGFMNTFADQPAVTAGLCVKALEEGIEAPYVQEIIRKRRLISERTLLHLEDWPWPLKIYSLGRFELMRDGKPIQYSRKAQEKPLSILKVLIAMKEREIRPEDIADILWPEADGDSAYHSLQVTLHRLRSLIGYPEAIQVRHGHLTLDSRYCWVDTWAFERLLEEADTRWGEGLPEKGIQLTEKAIGLYQGPFLGKDAEQFWNMSISERLRNKFLRSIGKLGDHWSQAGKWEKARDCYQKGLEVDDLAEGFCQGLMTCYQRLDQRAEALSLYRRFEKRLKAVLGVEPSEKTTALRDALMRGS